MKARVLAAIGLAAILSVAAAFLMRGAAPAAIPYRDADRVAEGRALYGEHCASCHGADLAGEADWKVPDADGYYPAPPHDETGHTWHHDDAQLVAITREGTEAVVGDGYRSRMAGFGEVLSDAEILSVLAYIKSTWPARVVETHDRINGRPGG